MTTTQTRAGMVSQLAELSVAERTISARRRDLHDRIDTIQLSAPLDEAAVTRLGLLEGQEREVSAQRRKLHERIDDLRAQLGLRIWRETHH